MNPPTETLSTKALDSKMWMKIFTIVVSFLVLSFASYNYFCQFSKLSSYSYSSNATYYDDLPTHGLVLDQYYELKKALKAASTKEKTVIITTLNKKWAEPNNVFDLFLESFRIGNNTARLLNHLLVITYDKKAYFRCRTSLPHCYLFKSKHLTKTTDKVEFMSSIYFEMVWERQELLHTILTFGYNIVYTDADVMWFRDPFPHFYPEADFQISCDMFNGNTHDWNNFGNNGFSFARSNKRTIEFYRLWISSRHIYPRLNEQEVLNKIKRRQYIKKLGLRIRHLDTNYFGGFCAPSKDLNKVCTMHANCCVGLDKKIHDLNLLLEDWKLYMSLPPNQTMQLKWRVPQKCDYFTEDQIKFLFENKNSL